MCGIVGVNFGGSASTLGERIFGSLLAASVTRGQDSSGALFVRPEELSIIKLPISGVSLGRESTFRDMLARQRSEGRFIAFGHSRMETHGTAASPENNHPVVSQNVAVIHNGIIVNAEDIWRRYPNRKSETEVDSESLCVLVREALSCSSSRMGPEIARALQSTLSVIQGSYSFIAIEPSLDFALVGTNTGSLWMAEDRDSDSYALASEERILREASNKYGMLRSRWVIRQLPVGEIIALPFLASVSKDAETQPTERAIVINSKIEIVAPVSPRVTANLKLIEQSLNEGYETARRHRESLIHCKKCILPESMPLISFDRDGICNYCRGYKRTEVLGRDILEEQLSKSVVGEKTIVPFSGGRDSSFALHFIKKELGKEVVAFTYDWGVLTDLGRRNQARMLGKLGVEQILVSADIRRKREYVRKNVVAWLRKPCLGMVPLFMAGDKHYFYHLHRLRKTYPQSLVVYADNRLEQSFFKYGFAGVTNNFSERKPYDLGTINKARLMLFYSLQFLGNTGYWNSSLIDTLTAYWASYFVPKNYLHIYRYIRWDQRLIENTLVQEYDWELAKDTASSWRIGDGTAAFYNYIYFMMGGLTEHDTFRSNQIREGLISREDALALALTEASPRPESIAWYFDTLGIDAHVAIQTINNVASLKPFK